jgi:mRNA-degrading endonuclease RelE of RelBE toxin-antitoxin system
MEYIKKELNQMKYQLLTKETLLQNKLKIFTKQMLKQYKDLCDPISEMISAFIKENTSEVGFSINMEEKSKINRFEYIKDQFVRWNDRTRRLMGKLHKLEITEDLMGNISQKIINEHRKVLKKLSEDKMEEYKDQFNQICNYKNKTGEEYKYYQNAEFCSYIITQTFKKTFNDMTEFLASSGSLLKINVSQIQDIL